jgi:hypothetical protein
MTIIDTNDEPLLPAIAELRSIPHWVCWRYEAVKGNGRPTKVPYSGITPFKASSRNPATWCAYERAFEAMRRRSMDGLGFVLSREIDIGGTDMDATISEDGHPVEWAKSIVNFCETYTEITPSGRGIRMFFRGEAPTIAASACGVEIYTSVRYLTVTGRHLPGTPTEIREAPRTIAALVARAEAWRADHEREIRASVSVSFDYDNGGPVSLAELQEILTYIPANNGRDEWLRVLMGIHEATGGSRDGLGLANAWSATGGIAYQGFHDVEQRWRSFKRSGITKNTICDIARNYGADLSEIAEKHRPSADLPDYTNLIVPGFRRSAAEERKQADPEPPPAGLMSETGEDGTGGAPLWWYPPGLIGEIADWITSTARRPNQPLAVAAATIIIATVCGRHISTPTACGTHLFIGCIGDTAIGKDRPLKAIVRIMDAIGCAHLAQTAKFKSDSAVEKTVTETPCCVAIVDEMGQNLLARMSHRRASTHEAGIGGVLSELWSTSFDVFMNSRRAGDAGGNSPLVKSPAFSLFGASTIDQFYNSVGAGAVDNGFMNRLTLFRAAMRADPRDVDPETIRIVPDGIKNGLLSLLPSSGSGPGIDLSGGKDVFLPHSEPAVQTIPWAAIEVKEAYEKLERSILAEIDRKPDLAGYLGRTAEMAIRLATVHAVGCLGRSAAVRTIDLEWGIAVAQASASTMLRDVKDRMYESEVQSRYILVRRIIKDAGRITRRELTRKLHGRVAKRDLDQVIDQLVDAGFCNRGRKNGEASGPAATEYQVAGGDD